MKFSKGHTYNTHDTSVEKSSTGRIQINQERGVKLRCELSVNALLRFGPKGASAEMIAQHLNKRLKANYTTSDVGYALKRLADEGVVKAVSQGKGEDTIFRAGVASLDHWRKLPKK